MIRSDLQHWDPVPSWALRNRLPDRLARALSARERRAETPVTTDGSAARARGAVTASRYPSRLAGYNFAK